MSTAFARNNIGTSLMNSNLRPWAASWYPGLGYVWSKGIDEDFPESNLQYCLGPRFQELIQPLYRGGQVVPRAPKVGQGMFTYVPDGTLFSGMKLGTWGSQHGTREEREAWVSRDMIGNFVLIRVKRTEVLKSWNYGVDERTELEKTEDGLSKLKLQFYNDVYEFPDIKHPHFRYEWLFGFVRSYDSYSGKHELVFKFDEFPVTGNWVTLEKCMFQEWGRADMRLLMKKMRNEAEAHREKWEEIRRKQKEEEEKESAIEIQRIWRGYQGRVYGDMPELISCSPSPGDMEEIYGRGHPNWSTEDGSEIVNSSSAPEQYGPPISPEQEAWVELFDVLSQRPYYYNKTTGFTTWNRPKWFVDPYKGVPRSQDCRPVKFVKPKKKRGSKRRFLHRAKLPQRDPKTHPEETNFVSGYHVQRALYQRDENDAGEDSTPMRSRHDERQWQESRAKARYWNQDVKKSWDWHHGNTEACERRAKTKWNTVSKNGDNHWGTRGRKGAVAQRAKTQVRRNRRRKMHNDTRSAGSDE